jgi:imidazole glycerol-phosphate synthase subunit HisF
MPIHIIQTGTANLASVMAAVARLGFEPVLTRSAEDVRNAERLILPGVGALGAAMAALREAGLVDPLRERLNRTAGEARTLCICLGLQMLLEASEESPGVAGLGVARGAAGKFSGAGLRVPQLGWNLVEPDAGCSLIERGWAYYANSYRLAEVPPGWSPAWTTYGGRFVGAMQRGGVLACQFHPELSGAWGERLIARWATGEGSHERRVTSDEAEAADGAARISSLVTRDSFLALPPRVIPCLDVRDGRVVKGVKFQNLRDAGDPAELAAAYAAQGADELVVLDVSATAEGRRAALATVARVRKAMNIPLTVGGGVKSEDDAAALLEAGADKIGVNTAAVERPEILSHLAERFGCQCVVLAVDARRRVAGTGPRGEVGAAGIRHSASGIRREAGGTNDGGSASSARPSTLGLEHVSGWEVVTRAGTRGTGIDAVEWARRAVGLGAGEILLTSWDRDGTGHGYDLELTRAIAEAASVPVIASGGAASPEHLVEALTHGASAVLAASIFHDGVWTVGGVKRRLAELGVTVRR